MVYTGNNGLDLQSRGGGFLDADFPDENQGVSGTPVAVHSGVLPNIRQVQNHLPSPPGIRLFSLQLFERTLLLLPVQFHTRSGDDGDRDSWRVWRHHAIQAV